MYSNSNDYHNRQTTPMGSKKINKIEANIGSHTDQLTVLVIDGYLSIHDPYQRTVLQSMIEKPRKGRAQLSATPGGK